METFGGDAGFGVERGGGVAPLSLFALAEEFGRLLARRELNRPDRRRGYSLPERLLGAVVMVLMGVLVARALDLLSH